MRPLRSSESIVNLPAANVNRYVEIGWVSSNEAQVRGRRHASDFLAVGHADPVRRDVQRQLPLRFEIRLIEHRHRLHDARGNEQGVQELIIPVERRISRQELELDDVLAFEERGGDLDVLVHHLRLDDVAVGVHRLQPLRGLREIEQQRLALAF